MNFARLIFPLVLLFLSSCSHKTQNKDTAEVNNMAKIDSFSDIEFESKVIDFGKIYKDTVLTAVFNFENVGSSPLIIYQVLPDCHCTNAVYNKEPIKVGSSGLIQLEFNTKDKIGFQKKYSIIKTNTKIGLYKISIKADIIR